MQSILHVMLLLDRESGMGKLQNIVEGNSDPKTQQAALQVMYMQYMKNPKYINEDVLKGILNVCKIHKMLVFTWVALEPKINRVCSKTSQD